MSILSLGNDPPLYARLAALSGRRAVTASLRKEAADATPVYNMVGTLYLSAASNYLMLSVPNALVHGAFAAMHEPGLELPPPGPGGRMEAHITVMRPEELESLGGAARVTERGKQFRYSIGRLKTVVPTSWDDVSRVFYLTVHSPELLALRRSYGLSALPNNGKHEFHITVGVVRRGVLASGPAAKKS